MPPAALGLVGLPEVPHICRTLELGEAIQAVLAEDAGLKELIRAEAAVERLQSSR